MPRHLVAFTQARVGSLRVPKDSGDKLGIDVNYYDAATLLVTKVNPGPVLDFNMANPVNELLGGDCITAINGVAGKVQELIEEIARSEPLTSVVLMVNRLPEQIVHVAGNGAAGLIVRPLDSASLLVMDVLPEFEVLAGSTRPEKHDRIVAVNCV